MAPVMSKEEQEHEDEEELAAVIVILQTVLGKRKNAEPVPYHTSSLSGEGWYKELMESDNENFFHDATRMKKDCFEKLIELLTTKGGLKDSTKQGKNTVAGQKIVMLIDVVVGKSNRQIHQRWQLSASTTSIYIHHASRAMMKCQDVLFFPPTTETPLHSRIADDPKYFPFFQDALGALDGTHIHAIIEALEQGPFRNRKKTITQNVLGVCNFDLTFSYMLTGWEVSAHDGRVLNDAKGKGLRIFPGKYYLGDAGYGLTRYCLTPYRGVRYHLKEWARGNESPQNKEELFNLRHSSLRNVIERIFGVLKNRFPLLVRMHSFPFKYQCKLVKIAAMLHNFIRVNQGDDDFDVVDEAAAAAAAEVPDEGLFAFDDTHSTNELNAWRDDIAQRMWDAYLAVRDERGL